jgi:hypothetical protein
LIDILTELGTGSSGEMRRLVVLMFRDLQLQLRMMSNVVFKDFRFGAKAESLAAAKRVEDRQGRMSEVIKQSAA